MSRLDGPAGVKLYCGTAAVQCFDKIEKERNVQDEERMKTEKKAKT